MEWYDIKKLPPLEPKSHSCPCLVVYESARGAQHVSQAIYCGNGKWKLDRGILHKTGKSERVTHWMPMPEPPKSSKG